MIYVHVPQESGSIALTDRANVRTFLVDGHLVSARTAEEADRLLRHVDGAKLATDAQVAAVKGTKGGDGQKPAAKD